MRRRAKENEEGEGEECRGHHSDDMLHPLHHTVDFTLTSLVKVSLAF